MAKAGNPISFAKEFRVKPERLRQLGVLNPTLAIDTRLFIDPLLLEASDHPEFHRDALKLYRQYFERIISVVRHCHAEGDTAWRTAYKLLDFPEVSGTCLGYGSGSIDGRGWGPKLRTNVLRTAKEVVTMGISDPNLFAVAALFEENMGPDRISDMVTNIAFPAVIAFNKRVLAKLKLQGEPFRYRGMEGSFVVNPYQTKKRSPVILMPTDILRELPVVNDWSEVSSAAAHNAMLRMQVNEEIGVIWKAQTKDRKQQLKDTVLGKKSAFETLMSAVREVVPKPYDADRDPHALINWSEIADLFAEEHPLSLKKPRARSLESLSDVVKQIVDQFRHLIEHAGLNKDLYHYDGRPRREATAQRLFFSIAYAYCKANNVDVSPEIDTGTGKIDFKFSTGFNARVLVEIKLSTNSNVVDGYTAQLEEYKAAQETTRAFYVLIDVGGMGKKDEKVIKERNKASAAGQPMSELEIIDATFKASPSKRKNREDDA